MVEINKYQKVWCLNGENWRPAPGYPAYQVSDMGRVRSLGVMKLDKNGKFRQTPKKILKCIPFVDSDYLRVSLKNWEDNKQYTVRVHRLVAMAFVPNPHGYDQINHRDENKTNNKAINLEWCDNKCNYNYGTCRARVSMAMKENWNKKRKKIIQYSVNGDILAVYKNASEAAEATGIKIGQITACARRAHNNQTAGGYVFRLEGDHFDKPIYGVLNNEKAVVCLTKDGEYVRDFYCIDAADRYFRPNVKNPSSNISQVLSGRNKTAYGYKWMYAKDYYKANSK